MKVFLSSVIKDYEQYRDSAAKATRTLRHDIIRAEDFGASPDTPQQVCLAGLRKSDLVVLILGARYGYVQPSGLSATHEEFKEARDTGKDLLVFVQQGTTPEPRQKELLNEVQAWASGKFTVNFDTPDELQCSVTTALHDLELSRVRGPVDETEILTRARQLMPNGRDIPDFALRVAVAGGPKQQILRPSELESDQITKDLLRMALFGDAAVLNPEHGTRPRVQGHALVVSQDNAAVLLDEMGSVSVVLPARQGTDSPSGALSLVLIEEDVRERIKLALRFAGSVLDKIDPTKRLSDIVPLVVLSGARYAAWRTRAEHEASPNRMSMSPEAPEYAEVSLSPASRKRGALVIDAADFAEDLTVLLRRRWRS